NKKVYEDTCGLKKDEPVERTYGPLLVALGPGLLNNIYDGIQRPLNDIYEQCKNIYVPKGISIPPINLEKKWHFYPNNEIKIGDFLASGTSIGYVEENILIKHYVLVEPNVSGTVTSKVEEGKYCVTVTLCSSFTASSDVLMTLKSEKNQNIDVKMIQYWPVRKSRPIKRKLTPSTPLFTGQRILDALFPCTQGGTVAIPGAFGCGKTVISQSISKYSNSDVVVYVGCGERGNEMAEVLRDFPELTIEKDNQTVSIMNRTTLVANTSNMPVSAREASIYT
ncbi:MAG: V-type proton ATPase catalytic subunit A, partial [Paramarteilia canceri]